MDLVDFLWDVKQQVEINLHDRQLASTDSQLDAAFKKMRELSAHSLRLACTCEVLCDVLIEKLGVTEDELKSLIQERITQTIRVAGDCPACGHRFHATRQACMYCGYTPEQPRDESVRPNS